MEEARLARFLRCRFHRSSIDWAKNKGFASITAAETSVKPIFAVGDDPLLLNDVPITKIATHERELNSLRLTGRKLDLVKSTKLPWWLRKILWIGNVLRRRSPPCS